MGFFGAKEEWVPPHPRQEPRIPGPITPERLKEIFQDCVDFSSREVMLHNDPRRTVTLCYLSGMVKMERVSDYVLRPLAQDGALSGARDMGEAYRLMRDGALYNLSVEVRTTLDQAVFDLIGGNCLLLFSQREEALSFNTGTEEKRSVSDPENEPAIKGAKDSFVESLRTNTSLVRRRLRAPTLKIKEQLVGRQTVTPVDILYLEGLTDPELVRRVEERIDAIDIDALLMTGGLEEYITDEVDTAFPLLAYTERPDRFCSGLVEGRVGVIMDGIPLGYLLPGTVGQFFKTGQDKSSNWMLASALTILRYLCMFVTLLLPGFYVAAVTFHPEMIPTRLALSIAAAKQDVPFSTVFEVLIMLVAFEILQEAGLRLPAAIGQTISILGGLVVGSAAVEAKIVSPAVLIVVATAGIAGYTMPSQDFAGALRIWRFLLAVAASVAGLFGVVMGTACLVCHLAQLESFGVAYLTPFAANKGEQVEGHAVIRQPLPRAKLRERSLKTRNRRNQG
jgi:spore germination protein KA